MPSRTRTPLPPTDPSTPTPRPVDSVNASPDAGRPLNVTDALSYLDAVKNQFQDRPEVYNKFLDIMKDFKSQQIDTPGVIQRVSKLFHGNPPLIQGFNTFLPAGYRIDINTDPTDPHSIIVTTPLGTTTQSTIHMNSSSQTQTQTRHRADIPGFGPNLAQSFTYSGMPAPTPVTNTLSPLGAGVNVGSRSLTPQQPFHIGVGGHVIPGAPYEQAFSPGFGQNPQTTAAASFLGGLSKPQNPNQMEATPQQTTGEFNHAIQYLNKIKARFSDDTNTYKQFLDILQAYQKEQKHLQDSQVYVQVQNLFKDAPDLLAEFMDFLPDVMGGAAGIPSNLGWPGQLESSVPGSPPKKGSASQPQSVSQATAAKRKKRSEKEGTPVPMSVNSNVQKTVVNPRSKRTKTTHHKGEPGSPIFSSPYPPGPPSPQSVHPQVAPISQQLPPGVPPSTSLNPNLNALHANPNTDKLLFFDRAKKSLENREIYEEFLKLLSLFSKDIIDVQLLLKQSQVFLGEDTELMEGFKELVFGPGTGFGYVYDSSLTTKRDGSGGVEAGMGPPGSIRTGPPEALMAQPVDDGQGPSYRKLPFSEIRLACSGRDQLCRSVLNDEWVSHPTWASEEAGFLTHKKNSFEEALHKSEEERHEYHVHLEALSRTISVLEPICARIEEMSSEDRAAFKLKSDFGGTGKAIYHRIIKKIYGRDSGLEVIQAMQDIPSVAVPVVLARLKQKDEEWRRAHREWSRTWREVDSKNFYKSLDHQGLTFKANDKKNITAKSFVADIERILEKQEKERDRELKEKERTRVNGKGKEKEETTTNRTHWRSVGAQLEYEFEDTSVVQGSLKLVDSFLNHSQAQYSPQERKGVEKFLRAFVLIMFSHPVGEFTSVEEDSDGLGGGSGRRSVASPYSAHTSGVAAGDLRKKLLKTAREKATANVGRDAGSRRGSAAPGSASGSRAASPPPAERRDSPAISVSRQEEEPNDVWTRETTTTHGSSNITEDSHGGKKSFFVNTTFYTLLRLLQVRFAKVRCLLQKQLKELQLLYSRLLMCKEIGARLASEKHSLLLANPVAVELGLDDPNGPATVLGQTTKGSGDANVVYLYVLNACEKMFAGDLDQSSFEEHMRWFFGSKAYHLFTLDRLIIALVKQVQTIISDAKGQELWSLLQSAHNSETLTNQDLIRYRREAERHVGQDDHLYRIQWVRESQRMRLYLMRPEDPSVDGVGTRHARWREYVDTYVMVHPTEWIGTGLRTGNVFLKRTRQQVRVGQESTGISIRVSLPSYKIVYDAGGEDVLTRAQPVREPWEVERARLREEERKRRFRLLFT
ncbi:hypothetical protein E1B28_001498 [Marasmius oreades]|uniref:Histone deacetylase interacting domain-containing protein n=1 Tax=Marasmius oreades TaxID=181124 RepID=A0A9P8AFL6_9AGAR|nr:uncharacterized protein E1B28_001498 [Marasmius oreades]KAG7099673.1 hypothetical protein E1B28_001498 [Marasmius oreades]